MQIKCEIDELVFRATVYSNMFTYYVSVLDLPSDISEFNGTTKGRCERIAHRLTLNTHTHIYTHTHTDIFFH